MVFAREERFPLKHFGEDASRTPNIDFDVVFLPREHNLWSTVISGRHISGHLRILDAGQAEIADLQVTILIDQYVTGLEISVHNACGVNIFQATLVFYFSIIIVVDDCSERTRIWYKKYWMNCFSSGLEVRRRWRSVPSSSVTK